MDNFLDYGQFLVLSCLTGGIVLIGLYFIITLADYAARCCIERYEQAQKSKGR